MRIQHNIMSMNAYRNYNTNTSALSKNLEKLSSGYKINRAGDDAAGLAISEKMRAQITGLNAASKNVKDGISLVKTAEGAMQEIQDMLNRMDYLATQSANGTYDDPVDRYNLQKEVNQLRSEINRIADSANFNGIKLLDGSQSLAESKIENVNVSVDLVGTVTVGVEKAGGTFLGTAQELSSNFQPNANTNNGLHTGLGAVTQTDAKFSIDISGITVTGVSLNTATGVGTKITITVGGVAISAAVSSSSSGVTVMSGTDVAALFNGQTVTIDSVEYKLTASSGKITFAATTAGTCDKHAETINAAIRTEVQVTVTSTDGKGDIAGDWLHGVYDITDAVDNRSGGMAGVSFKLDGNIVADGNTLTIGDKTYKFKLSSSTNQDGADFLIDLSNFKGTATQMYAEAARQMAVSTTTIGNTVAGTVTNFKITAVDDNVIHIDQIEDKGVVYDKQEMLKAMFKVDKKVTTAVNAEMELSAAPGAASGLNPGDRVGYQTVDEKGNTVYKSYIIGTAPDDAKDSEKAKYISADDFNSLFQSDANRLLKDAAEKVLKENSEYNGKFEVEVSGDNVKIKAKEGNNDYNETYMKNLKDAIATAAGTVKISKISKEDVAKGLTLQIGDTSDSFNQLRVNVGDMHVDAMGTMETVVEGGRQTVARGQSIDDIDISTQEGAHAAVDIIKNAINYVSSIRGDLGATQNRLEHTANNLSVMTENIQDAESTIRDTDVAEEMMAYTKNNILVQSAQAMLAQANAVPQGVLQLLG